jgi:O-antigen biosynthesis protein WbqP
MECFLGEMSLVGPRLGLPAQLSLAQARRDISIFDLLSDINGIGQLEGPDRSTPDKPVQSYEKYVVDWNFILDLNIVSHTAIGEGLDDISRATNR